MSFTGRDNDFLQTSVSNNGFFPALSLGELQKVYRVPANAPEEAITNQLKIAIATVNRELYEKQLAWQTQGFADLEEADASDDHEKDELVMMYKVAVFMWCKAELLEDFETFSRRDIADNIANQKYEVWKNCKKNSRSAINYLLNRTPAVSVELI